MNSAANLLNKSFEPFLQEDLGNILEKIAGEIEFKSDFRVSHPQLGTFSLTERIKDQFQQLSQEVQQQYLCVQLQTLLHDFYYRRTQVNIQEEDKLENQAIKWKKRKFFQELHRNNFGQGYFDFDWLIIGEEQDKILPVRKNDLIVHISPLRHLQPSDRYAKVGDFVAVKMPAKMLEQGYYIALGDGGAINYQNSDFDENGFPGRNVVNIYFNLTAEGALAIMSSITQQLNQLNIPFNFKVLYNSDDYPLEDAATLSIERQHYELVRPILKDIYLANCVYFYPEIPLFTKSLALGLSLAEEPISKSSAVESFGLHRFQPIAEGLINAWQQGDNLPEQKIKSILNCFFYRKIDLKLPYLNANSEDIYNF